MFGSLQGIYPSLLLRNAHNFSIHFEVMNKAQSILYVHLFMDHPFKVMSMIGKGSYQNACACYQIVEKIP